MDLYCTEFLLLLLSCSSVVFHSPVLSTGQLYNSITFKNVVETMITMAKLNQSGTKPTRGVKQHE